MLFKIAWRNLWRNKRRTLIVLTSVIVGVIIILLNDGLGIGFIKQMLEIQINTSVAHIQIHNKSFLDDRVLSNSIKNPNYVDSILQKTDFVKHYSKRLINFGMLSSAANSSGIVLYGIEPEKEKQLTIIHSSIIKGTYLSGKPNEIIIGKKLAERLEVELGDKLVAISSNIDGKPSSELFRIVGIFKTSDTEFDKMTVFVDYNNLENMLSTQGLASEFAILSDNPENAPLNKAELIKLLNIPNLEVKTYIDLLPLIMSYIDSYQSMMFVFYLIFGIAVLFGIINSMLMAVFERIREIGVLMSIGMKNSKIFFMIVYESLCIGVLGTMIGTIIGSVLLLYLQKNGIDLSFVSDTLNQYGMNAVIYPELSFQVIFSSILVMPITAVVAAIYPAIKAIKLQPTDAMRHV